MEENTFQVRLCRFLKGGTHKPRGHRNREIVENWSKNGQQLVNNCSNIGKELAKY